MALVIAVVGALPTSSLAAAGTSVQSCTEQELVSPTVSSAFMALPGKVSQTTSVTIDIGAAPEECKGVVQRKVQYEVIKSEVLRLDGKLRRRVSRLARWPDSDFRSDAAGTISQSNAANPHNTRTYYRCSYGRAKTKVRVKLRIAITDLSSMAVVAQSIFWGPPVEIRGINGGRGC